MNLVMDGLVNDHGRLKTSSASPSSDVNEPSPSSNTEHEANQRETIVQWLNNSIPHVSLPINASDEDIREVLLDGTALCQILNKLKPGSLVTEVEDPSNSLDSCPENVRRFLLSMEKLGLPRFKASDLENGSMKVIFDCLIALRARFRPQFDVSNIWSTRASDLSGNVVMTRWKSMVEHGGRSDAHAEDPSRFRSFSSFCDDRRNSKSFRALRSQESSAALLHHVGHKFHEVFQLKQGSYADLPAAKITEMMKSNSLDNAPTQSLLTLVNGIIDESIERKNGEIPLRVSCLLRKVVQEIERRISTQAEHLRMQNNLFKAREEKYQSRIRVLEALATGTSEETQIVMNQLQQIKSEKTKMEVKKKIEEHDVARLLKEKDEADQEIEALKRELKTALETYEQHCSRSQQEIEALKRELETARETHKQQCSQVETNGIGSQQEVSALKQELETARKAYEEEIATLKQELEQQCSQVEKEAKGSQQEVSALKKELEMAREAYEQETAALKQEIKTAHQNHEQQCSQVEKEARGSQHEIETLRREFETSRKAYEEEIEAFKRELETTHEQHRLRVEKEAKGSQQEIETLRQELEKANKAHEQAEIKARGSEEEIAALKRNLETAHRTYEKHRSQVEKEAKRSEEEIKALKQELETAHRTYEQHRLQVEKEAKASEEEIRALKQELGTTQGSRQEMEDKLKEITSHLAGSRNRVKELEMIFEAKSQQWNKTRHIYEIFTEFQLGALRELKFSSQTIRQEVVKTQKIYIDEFNCLGVRTRALEEMAANYHVVLDENRKLHNEVQELKGNIRVYCRVRPFLPGQKDKQTIVEYVGDNGELIVTNPSKQGKEARRSFKFNKVYNPAATQGQVFSDIQPLIRSVLDGYSVCIFAYGQTGSGKTYTMTGPDGATEEEYGVNYRALNDLFQISQRRQSTISYKIAVQIVEIYNEHIRDLLSSDGSQKNLSVLPTTQPNGLAVPDASMYPVKTPGDVLDLMNVGLKNRAKSSTAMNERSSRSHSVVTIHICGKDVRNGSSMRSSLHLVDLAGSERVDRSEVKGDRLKEAQHINKSLAALGDVISALAQKSAHVPYRNSKLTQVLQTSLGGQAKTLMFVQLNPDHSSYSESISTLKFAERVSGVELGAAKSSKDSKDVRELMEQVASLKDALAKRDEEIEKLRTGRDNVKNATPNGDKRGVNSLRH